MSCRECKTRARHSVFATADVRAPAARHATLDARNLPGYSTGMPRHLRVTIRTVPAGSQPDYAAGWRAFVAAARSAGANAWRFRAAEDPDRYMEFLEWQDDGSHAAAAWRDGDIAGLGAALDSRFGAGDATGWQEAPPT
jgi:hypothetical protein